MHLFNPEWFYVINFDIFFARQHQLDISTFFLRDPIVTQWKKKLNIYQQKEK